MNVLFTANAWEDYCELLDKDPRLSKKLRALLKEISRTPYQGTGKPEALKFELQGFWSRRLSREHRLVYQVSEEEDVTTCLILQCYRHY